MREAHSYFARYWSTDNRTLIGGVLQGQTGRFERREDAETRLQQTLELNGVHCEGEVAESHLYPEVLIHCGAMPQAIGGKWFGCGKVLTVADAEARSACGKSIMGLLSWQPPSRDKCRRREIIMTMFEIEQYELHAMKYRVEAESEAQAIAGLFDGEAEPVEQSQDYIEIAEDHGLPVDEHRELADRLRALGVPVGEAVIPSIRSIERVEE